MLTVRTWVVFTHPRTFKQLIYSDLCETWKYSRAWTGNIPKKGHIADVHVPGCRTRQVGRSRRAAQSKPKGSLRLPHVIDYAQMGGFRSGRGNPRLLNKGKSRRKSRSGRKVINRWRLANRIEIQGFLENMLINKNYFVYLQPQKWVLET